jgi:hypothetical protein
LDGSDPRCVVSIIGCTGDWFGGWDGLEIGTVDQFITADLRGGRLPQVIERGEPAVLVCHWPGIYCNGDETGFNIFKQVVARLHDRYDNLVWMKLSEIARYWAAKELTTFKASERKIALRAPFASPDFTVEVDAAVDSPPKLIMKQKPVQLTEVDDARKLQAGTWLRRKDKGAILCFDLSKGDSQLEW